MYLNKTLILRNCVIFIYSYFSCHISVFGQCQNHAYWQKLFRYELRLQETPGTISRSANILEPPLTLPFCFPISQLSNLPSPYYILKSQNLVCIFGLFFCLHQNFPNLTQPHQTCPQIFHHQQSSFNLSQPLPIKPILTH